MTDNTFNSGTNSGTNSGISQYDNVNNIMKSDRYGVPSAEEEPRMAHVYAIAKQVALAIDNASAFNSGGATVPFDDPFVNKDNAHISSLGADQAGDASMFLRMTVTDNAQSPASDVSKPDTSKGAKSAPGFRIQHEHPSNTVTFGDTRMNKALKNGKYMRNYIHNQRTETADQNKQELLEKLSPMTSSDYEITLSMLNGDSRFKPYLKSRGLLDNMDLGVLNLSLATDFAITHYEHLFKIPRST